MKKTFKFTFPFTGQVKTQLIISKNRLVKPKNVKRFEDAVSACLATAFPLNHRPIEGYFRFQMVNYTQFKRDDEGIISPIRTMDLDNIFKLIADCFQPVYKKMTKLDENGEMEFTEKGNPKYTKIEVTPGVIKDDKYIMRAGLYWVPVHKKEDEKIEVYISQLNEEELFIPPNFDEEDVINLSF